MERETASLTPWNTATCSLLFTSSHILYWIFLSLLSYSFVFLFLLVGSHDCLSLPIMHYYCRLNYFSLGSLISTVSYIHSFTQQIILLSPSSINPSCLLRFSFISPLPDLLSVIVFTLHCHFFPAMIPLLSCTSWTRLPLVHLPFSLLLPCNYSFSVCHMSPLFLASFPHVFPLTLSIMTLSYSIPHSSSTW